MSGKLHTDEYDVKRTDGNVLSGDSNKIKLKITSYAVILEVQEAYMQEEIAAKEQEKENLEQQLENEDLSRKEKREKKKNLSLLNAELDILNDVFHEFSESRKRFMEIAKKALKLPEENLKQLAENGWLEIDDKKVNIDTEYEKIQNKLMDVQDDENVFTNVDTDAIKEAVDQAMNGKSEDLPEGYKNDGDYIVENITSGNFENVISNAAEEIKDTFDGQNPNRLTEKDVVGIFENAGTVPSEDPEIENEEAETEFKPFEPENTNTESPTIEFNVPHIAGETGEWTLVQQPTNENQTFTGFDSDKSIESFIKGLEDRNASLKAHGEELNSKISDVKSEQTKAAEKQKQAKKECEAAKKRAEDTKRQIELLNTYRPKMDELRKANEEQEKLNSAKEEELRKENEALAAINSETTAIETETASYDEEASQSLEELKRLRAEFAGTGYDSGDTQMTSGGRTM